MKLLPKATKTSLARLVRAKGYDIPIIRYTCISRVGHSFFLRWTDNDGQFHKAYYAAVGGKPMLLVDATVHELTIAEVIQYGLVTASVQ
ncbi:MAG: hypothetical protein Q4P84_03350 [Elusimicrobiales bacterium]|nr:hypothetical protein [Elusimicrobiales bacterium]